MKPPLGRTDAIDRELGNDWNRRISSVASGRGDGPLSNHRAAGQLAQRERVFMPRSGHARRQPESLSRLEADL